MSAIVMKCILVEEHPNADALKVYHFTDLDTSDVNESFQIVANLENVYEVGDSAIIVLAPSCMKDGMIIKERNVRGVISQGMALGKTDKPVGTDLSEEYLQPEGTINHIPWPDIESLFNIRRWLKVNNTKCVVPYRAKIKLDGTNASVMLPPADSSISKRVIPQSRNRIINVDDDNLGFAKWVITKLDFFMKVRENADACGLTDHITVFGEYAGQGIQKRTAISKIDKKIFAIFAVQIGTIDAKLETDPEKIGDIIFGKGNGCPEGGDVYVLPWHSDTIQFDFTDVEKLQCSTDIINQTVDDVEKCDPWVKETFGIQGIGEGVVMYPIFEKGYPMPKNLGQGLGEGTLISRDTYSNFVWKAKGEKHKVVNAKKPAQIDPEFVATIDGFVDLFVTENRLEQIAQKVGGFDMKNTGSFMKEFAHDVQKESVAEMEAAGINWKQVAKAVGDRARKWWVAKCNEDV